jgi:biopolymer transport protein ExbB
MEEAKHVPRTNSLLSAILPRDLSLWGMFLNAVLPVKIVMVGLALASVAAWTVILAKIIELWGAKRLARRGLKILAHATNLHGAKIEFVKAKSHFGRLPTVPKGLLQKASRTVRPHCFRASKHRRHELYHEKWVFSR